MFERTVKIIVQDARYARRIVRGLPRVISDLKRQVTARGYVKTAGDLAGAVWLRMVGDSSSQLLDRKLLDLELGCIRMSVHMRERERMVKDKRADLHFHRGDVGALGTAVVLDEPVYRKLQTDPACVFGEKDLVPGIEIKSVFFRDKSGCIHEIHLKVFPLASDSALHREIREREASNIDRRLDYLLSNLSWGLSSREDLIALLEKPVTQEMFQKWFAKHGKDFDAWFDGVKTSSVDISAILAKASWFSPPHVRQVMETLRKESPNGLAGFFSFIRVLKNPEWGGAIPEEVADGLFFSLYTYFAPFGNKSWFDFEYFDVAFLIQKIRNEHPHAVISLCHPSSSLSMRTLEELLCCLDENASRTGGRSLDGIETDYPSLKREDRAALHALARRFELHADGGSDGDDNWKGSISFADGQTLRRSVLNDAFICGRNLYAEGRLAEAVRVLRGVITFDIYNFEAYDLLANAYRELRSRLTLNVFDLRLREELRQLAAEEDQQQGRLTKAEALYERVRVPASAASAAMDAERYICREIPGRVFRELSAGAALIELNVGSGPQAVEHLKKLHFEGCLITKVKTNFVGGQEELYEVVQEKGLKKYVLANIQGEGRLERAIAALKIMGVKAKSIKIRSYGVDHKDRYRAAIANNISPRTVAIFCFDPENMKNELVKLASGQAAVREIEDDVLPFTRIYFRGREVALFSISHAYGKQMGDLAGVLADEFGVTEMAFVGACGGVAPDVRLNDIVAFTNVSDMNGRRTFVDRNRFSAAALRGYFPDFGLKDAEIFTEQTLFAQTREDVEQLRAQGIGAVELELAYVARALRDKPKVRFGAILEVVDLPGRREAALGSEIAGDRDSSRKTAFRLGTATFLFDRYDLGGYGFPENMVLDGLSFYGNKALANRWAADWAQVSGRSAFDILTAPSRLLLPEEMPFYVLPLIARAGKRRIFFIDRGAYVYRRAYALLGRELAGEVELPPAFSYKVTNIAKQPLSLQIQGFLSINPEDRAALEAPLSAADQRELNAVFRGFSEADKRTIRAHLKRKGTSFEELLHRTKREFLSSIAEAGIDRRIGLIYRYHRFISSLSDAVDVGGRVNIQMFSAAFEGMSPALSRLINPLSIREITRENKDEALAQLRQREYQLIIDCRGDMRHSARPLLRVLTKGSLIADQIFSSPLLFVDETAHSGGCLIALELLCPIFGQKDFSFEFGVVAAGSDKLDPNLAMRRGRGFFDIFGTGLLRSPEYTPQLYDFIYEKDELGVLRRITYAEKRRTMPLREKSGVPGFEDALFPLSLNPAVQAVFARNLYEEGVNPVPIGLILRMHLRRDEVSEMALYEKLPFGIDDFWRYDKQMRRILADLVRLEGEQPEIFVGAREIDQAEKAVEQNALLSRWESDYTKYVGRMEEAALVIRNDRVRGAVLRFLRGEEITIEDVLKIAIPKIFERRE